MRKQPSRKLTRYELAALITELRGDVVTYDQVRKSEDRWGLAAARGKDLSPRVVRYDEQLALSALRACGVVPELPGAIGSQT